MTAALRAAWVWGRILPRLFISHSSKDNVAALTFKRWLIASGWAAEDVFLDLHGIGAGERWRDTLRKANASCEAVLLLASPDSLDSQECQREINLAEDLGKEMIVAIVRDLPETDPRLSRWADRQFVDLSAAPAEQMEPFEHDGRVHRVEFNSAALASIKARLSHLGIAPGSFAWEPKSKTSGPYPGLAAFGEEDAGIFFGREAEIMAGLTRLRVMRKRRSPRLLVIVAASGAGKSSYLRAGLWPRLKRDPDFAPLAILRPALGILTGPDGLGRQIAPFFEHLGRTKVPGDISGRLAMPGPEAMLALSGLIGEATALATAARRAGAPDARPPAPLIAIDQGEEMFAAENAAESERFLELLAAVLKEPPAETDPYVLVTIRADSVEALLQRWPALGLDTPESHYLPPLPPSAHRDVIVKPAEVYTERVRRLMVEPALVDALARDATGADALPLLAFTLEKLFHEFGADGNLTLARYDGMKGMGGSIDRALAEAQRQAGASGSADSLRRLMVPGLATWDPIANAAKRLVAREGELLAGDRAALAPLANALVANRLLTRGAGTVEVAHEALLRRPPIDGWLEAQKDALKLRDDILKEAKDWADSGRHAEGIVRRGDRLQSAARLAANADFTATLAPAKDYLRASQKLESAGRRKARWAQAAIFTLLLSVIGGLSARVYEREINGLWFQYLTARPNLVTDQAALAKKPGDPFWDCSRTDADYSRHCPGMVLVPAGEFTRGSPDTEKDRMEHEGPLRKVTIKVPFAVAMHAVTFNQWDTCVASGGCRTVAWDSGWPRGRRPVINVNWGDAQEYVTWLSKMTGHAYRLLTEAEYEYAARSGNQARWSFGDDEDHLKDYAWFNENTESKTQPVGLKKPNAFGLYDMHGNVYQWVQDCYVDSHKDAPTDGTSVPEKEGCRRVVRGASWLSSSQDLRSANRISYSADDRNIFVGFRVARSVVLPSTL